MISPDKWTHLTLTETHLTAAADRPQFLSDLVPPPFVEKLSSEEGASAAIAEGGGFGRWRHGNGETMF